MVGFEAVCGPGSSPVGGDVGNRQSREIQGQKVGGCVKRNMERL